VHVSCDFSASRHAAGAAIACTSTRAAAAASSSRLRCTTRRCRCCTRTRPTGHDGAALADALIAAGVPCAPLRTVPQALAHPHTAHRGMPVELPGGYRGVGAPVKLARTPASYRTPPLAEGDRFLPPMPWVVDALNAS
jgi:CoA transferase family III